MRSTIAAPFLALLAACSGGLAPVEGGDATAEGGNGGGAPGGFGGGGIEAEDCVTLAPAAIDFGTTDLGCQTLERSLVVTNRCEGPITLGGIDQASVWDPEVFLLVDAPATPQPLLPGERAGFAFGFRPKALGSEEASISIGFAKDRALLAKLQGEADPESLVTDVFHMPGRPKADVLWVIDNTQTMAPHRQRLLDHLEAFPQWLTHHSVDLHLAVTTTGLAPAHGCGGAAQGGEDGRFHPIDGAHRIVTNPADDLIDRWMKNVDVGVCHNSGFPFEAAFRALSEPLILETRDSRHDGPWDDGNAGFLRADAALSIVFVSARDDASFAWGRSLDDYIDFFIGIKGPRNSNLFRLHVIGGTPQGSPGCLIEPANRLGAAADATEGLWLDLCDLSADASEWEPNFSMPSMRNSPQRFFLSERPGDSNGDGAVDELDLQLEVNGVPRPARFPSGSRAWTYDPISNAIDFSPLGIPRPDSEIIVSYQRPCPGA